jgi:hypothetical protein
MVAAACTDDTGPAYEQFNAQEEVMEVRVGEAEIGDVALLELHSSTGAIVIGEASINPDAGPSGSIHDLEVQILDEYVHRVDRVSVEIDAGERGVQTYDLNADSADEALYRLEIQSFAEDSEIRTDVLEIQVWDLIGDQDGESE